MFTMPFKLILNNRYTISVIYIWYILSFIIVPKVRIFGDRDIFVKSSSTVQLKCVVSQSLVAPTYMEWRHNTQRIPIAATVGSQSSGLVMLPNIILTNN